MKYIDLDKHLLVQSVESHKMRIVKYPDPLLNRVAEPVTTFDEKLDKFVADMFTKMYESSGVGLAAPQVGVSRRIFVVNINPSEPDEEKRKETELAFINPVLSDLEGDQREEEGCLSIPGIRHEVNRSMKLKVVAQNVKGEEFTLEADEYLAEVIQHEFDHIEGILFIQRLSAGEQIAIQNQLKYLRSQYQKEKQKRKKDKLKAVKAQKKKFKH